MNSSIKKIALGSLVLDIESNTLYDGDDARQIEPKLVDVVFYLYQHQGRVVTREQLTKDVWRGQVVSSNAVSRAISQIRQILKRSAEPIPQIETIPKVGYRLSINITDSPSYSGISKDSLSEPSVADTKNSEQNAAEAFSPAQPGNSFFNNNNNKQKAENKNSFGLDIASLKIIFFIAFSITIFYHMFSDYFAKESSFDEYKLSALPINEEYAKAPCFSPDGQYLVYAGAAKESNEEMIYLTKLFGKELEAEPTGNVSGLLLDMAWSPDSKSLVVSRWNNYYQRQCEVILYHLERGNQATLTKPQKLFDCSERSSVNLAWSADGKTVYFTDRESYARPYAVYSYSLISKKTSQLTLPPQGGNLRGDYKVVGRLDGKRLIIIRYLSGGQSQASIYDLTIPLDLTNRDFESQALIKRFELNARVSNISWFGNYDAVLIDDDKGLRRFDYLNESYQSVFGDVDNLSSFSTDSLAERIFLVRQTGNMDLVDYSLTGDSESRRLTASRYSDLMPTIANSSENIAFLSDRSGLNQIWMLAENGAVSQLSSAPASLGLTPLKWSPDDDQIMFQYEEAIYSLDVLTGTISRIIEKSHRPANASWSLDGKSVFYSSDKSGEWQIWELNLLTKGHRQITRFGGYSVNQHSSGDLIVSRIHEAGLWRLKLKSSAPASFAAAVKILDKFEGTNWLSWNLDGNKVYYFGVEGGIKVGVESGAAGIFEFDLTNDLVSVVVPFEGRQRRYFSVKSGRVVLTQLMDRRSTIERLDSNQ